MKTFILALLLILFGCSARAGAPVTVRLDVDGGICSGTVVAPSVILSAQHCFQEEEEGWGLPLPAPTTMRVDGYQVKILAIVFDDNDHAMVKVDFVFRDYAHLAKPAPVGTHIHYWGNPAGLMHVYREGYVASYHHSEMMMDINGFFGDSGTGIFDEHENLVGVISFISAIPHSGLVFELMGANPLEFTPMQYEMMGVSAP